MPSFAVSRRSGEAHHTTAKGVDAAIRDVRTQRFNTAERPAHRPMVISFCSLAISEVVMVFGYSLFFTMATVCRNVDNFVGPPFMVSAHVFIMPLIRDKVWQAVDALWIRDGVGLLNVPYFEQGRVVMQIANVVHLVGSLPVTTLSLLRIYMYMGSIGMEGALDSMKTDYVNETWTMPQFAASQDRLAHRHIEQMKTTGITVLPTAAAPPRLRLQPSLRHPCRHAQ